MHSAPPSSTNTLLNRPPTLLEIYRAEFVPSKDPATLRRHLDSPIAKRIRAAKQEQLAKIEAGSWFTQDAGKE